MTRSVHRPLRSCRRTFDDRGRRFDKDGNLRDWWTPEDDRRYRERAKKV